MVTMKEGELFIELKMSGGGEALERIQNALLLGIDYIGSHPDCAGSPSNCEAVFTLSEILRG